MSSLGDNAMFLSQVCQNVNKNFLGKFVLKNDKCTAVTVVWINLQQYDVMLMTLPLV